MQGVVGDSAAARGRGAGPHLRLDGRAQVSNLTESVHKVVLQQSIPAQIRNVKNKLTYTSKRKAHGRDAGPHLRLDGRAQVGILSPMQCLQPIDEELT